MRGLRNLGYLFTSVAGGTAAAVFWNVEKENEKVKNQMDNYSEDSNSQWPRRPWNSNWDKRSPGSLLSPKEKERIEKDDSDEKIEVKSRVTKATRHLFLIRHGQYEMKASPENKRLTELGREQADLTGRRLKDLAFPFTQIVSSSLIRAIETADIVHKHLPNIPRLTNCPLLEEGYPIVPEPSSAHWRPDLATYEDGPRIEAAFRKYCHRAEPEQTEDSYEIIVCHANVIRYFVCRALQFPPEGWLRIGLHNGSITWLSIRPNGNVSLYTLGDSGHIPPQQLSTS